MPPSVTVTVAPTEVTFAAVGNTVRLTAEVRNQAGEVVTNASVGWTSLNLKVAQVDASGLVTGTGSGTTMIRAHSASAFADARVTVRQVPTGLGISPPRLEFTRIGDNARLVASFTDANDYAIPGATGAIWSSTDTVVATVDSTGLVTATRNGSAIVTALADSFGTAGSVAVADPSVGREAL